MIEIKGLKKSCRGVTPLGSIDLKLKNGGVCGILELDGESGSLLLSLMAGVLLPDEGYVRINGFDMAREPQKAKTCLGFVPAQAPLYDELTPLEQLSFVAEARMLPYERGQRMIRDALELTQAEALKNCVIAGLNREARVRVALAQALIGNSDILVLDEPTAGLDRRASAAIWDLLRLLGESKTLLVSGSDPELLCSLCGQLLVLSGGELTLNAPTEELDARALKAQLHAAPAQHSQAEPKKAAVEYDGEYELIEVTKKEKN